MMLRILRDKFVRIGRDDDGMAMVVTLAVFMFMWLVCMGVYAIGTAVKTRIHLQNACDAAAYSAAVVQADTLSRIATINRAMSWTYVQMARRQMDYIVDRWLTKTIDKVKEDVATAKAVYGSGIHTEPDHKKYWDLRGSTPTTYRLGRNDDEDDTYVSLNRNSNETSVMTIKINCSYFENNWYASDTSFYNGAGRGIEVLRNQIGADRDTLNAMFEAEENLAKALPERVSDTVENVMQANVPPALQWRHRVFQSLSPYVEGGSEVSFMEILGSTEEERFLGFARYFPSDRTKPFDRGSGNGQWFPLSEEKGFLRKYRQCDSALVANWLWQTWKWHCDPDDSTKCWVESHKPHENFCKGKDAYDPWFDGVAAKPLVLTKDYFDKNGTITVGIAVENKNPWSSILGAAIRGIFSAFNYGSELPWTPQYTVCFASAKAGWKEQLNWGNVESVENNRVYRVDWEDGDWNLCQSDWDAVLIPVRRAESPAVNGSWGDGNVGFLDSYARQIGVHSTNMRAGGTKEMTLAQWRDGNGRNLPPDYYRFGRVGGRGGWRELPDGGTWDWESGAVNTEWQIEKKSQPIDFNNLQRVMFH